MVHINFKETFGLGIRDFFDYVCVCLLQATCSLPSRGEIMVVLPA
jgi:hypothetical protein